MQAHQIQRQEIMMVLAKSPFEVFPISSTCYAGFHGVLSMEKLAAALGEQTGLTSTYGY